MYQASDSKLGRDVAIKVVPGTFVHDPERLSRFEREAKMLAALNYPNIATICRLVVAARNVLFHTQIFGGLAAGAGNAWGCAISKDCHRFLINSTIEQTTAVPGTLNTNWTAIRKKQP